MWLNLNWVCRCGWAPGEVAQGNEAVRDLRALGDLVLKGCELSLVLGKSRLCLWKISGAFLVVCLKVEPRRQVFDFYLYLAKLTQKSSLPELQLASVTAWNHASSGFIQGLSLKVERILSPPDTGKQNCFYVIKKQDSYLAYKRLQLLHGISHWASQLCNAEP